MGNGVTHHFIDGVQDLGEARNDQRELVLADVDEALFVLLHVDARVRRLRTTPARKLRRGRECAFGSEHVVHALEPRPLTLNIIQS